MAFKQKARKNKEGSSSSAPTRKDLAARYKMAYGGRGTLHTPCQVHFHRRAPGAKNSMATPIRLVNDTTPSPHSSSTEFDPFAEAKELDGGQGVALAQLWAFEKLQVIDPPSDHLMFDYRPRVYVRHRRHLTGETVEDWTTIFQDFTSERGGT
ncbi:hypothetical protein JCGZ_25432 [Jatropha curcas]|uniref:Uncharacterized protein n=1 Tax=Jatropha curcas TaxID=180498 RepID=A0A067JLD0_JATCU|nr:hypothetical protein JCGZ_25432 [Jatropha curcas]